MLYSIYDYDKELFISLFCENIDRPEFNCDGKCYLAKVQQEKNDEDAANRLKQLQTEIIYNYPERPATVDNVSTLDKGGIKKISYRKSLYAFDFTSSLVKPPEISTLNS